MTERIVIIGAGQAGLQAVASLRAEGFGGSIVLVGEEAYPPYQRPPLSKAYLAGTFERERLFLKPESFYADAKCDVRLNARAIRIDRAAKTVHLADGGVLPYDKLLLATGARVRPIPVPGATLPSVHYLRNIADVDALRPHLKEGARLAVVGGGYIGLEVAAVARKYGLSATVIEAAGRVMARAVSPPVSDFYEKAHREAGVVIVLNETAQSFDGTERVTAVRTNSGRIVPADFVLVGIGVMADADLAEQAGLPCDNGIVVDECARTIDPDIFAAGDCTNHPGFYGERLRLESVQNAVDQAKAAALAMLDRPHPYREVPWFWSDQYDLKLQIAGLIRPDDRIVVRGDPANRKFSVFHVRAGVLAAVEAVNAAPDYIAGRKLIAEGRPVDAEKLSDITIPMKSFIQ
jgi:3-phenylpropionate/trans-cinnamate dioxygenase ferredoxin reductase subunit